ncbi:MAG: pyridoxal phosphate-dependent aminotransferase [Chryseobacterium sp.]|nr:MAG: pyridoxal phosphate-dependent aminotransferase [Chryseobacterium sp.]
MQKNKQPFNFDEIINRRETDSLKWAIGDDPTVLPMWIADMDFKTAPAITEALIKKVNEGIFGYPSLPKEFNTAIESWWEKRHNFQLDQQWIVPAEGAESAISAAISTLASAGNGVIIQTPVYNHFFTMIENCGCRIVENPLINTNGNYQIDFYDLEQKAADPNTNLLLLCNPHNPVGRVWAKEELEKIASICSKNNVAIISNEVYADLSYFHHTPFLSLSNSSQVRGLSCSSPGKPFNLSGLKVAYLLAPDPILRENIAKSLALSGGETISSFGTTALIAAYNEGEEWLKALKNYLKGNFDYLQNFLNEQIPEITVSPMQATYLVWLDCRKLKKPSIELQQELLIKGKLWVNAGTLYGMKGEGFLRLNIACPRSLLIKCLNLLHECYGQGS